MKGYLINADGLFQLAPKVTTIGREGCDLVIQSLDIDLQHAVIEYSEHEQCFVLQDLNTANGTFVNDCRVQNAAVRLAPGDYIRFGCTASLYELQMDNQQPYSHVSAQNKQMSYPPVHQRPALTQPLTVIPDGRPPEAITQEALPQLKSVVATTHSTWSAGASALSSQMPRPPASIRSRPMSAGTRRPLSAFETRQASQERSPPQTAAAQRSQGWVSGGASPARTITTVPQQADFSLVQEKEQRILRLGEEVKRLSMYEAECARKEDLTQQLREEVRALQMRIRSMETGHVTASMLGTDADVMQKLVALENEVQQKRSEIASLREQTNRLRDVENMGSAISRQDFNDRVMEVNSLKTELERVRKDRNITSGLVTQMQRDMANKDTTIGRLTRDMEALKKEMNEKEVQLTSMQSKLEEFVRTQDDKRTEEECEAKDKELATLRLQLKMAENSLRETRELTSSLKDEMEKHKEKATEDKEAQKKLQRQLDEAQSQFQDVERAERMVRVDLEQTSKRMERFRHRVVQVTFSTPGIRAPDTEISDDELLETLKKIIDERTDMTRRLADAKDNLKQANSVKKEVLDNSKRVKQQLNESMLRLLEKGRLSGRLRQEAELLQTLAVDETVAWMKEVAVEIFQGELAWQTDIETALQDSGINVKLSDEAPGHHIRQLHGQWLEAIQEKDETRTRLGDVEVKHREELESALASLRQELEAAMTEQVEKAKLEGEEKMNCAIDDIRALEEEKNATLLESERSKIACLEASLEQLKASILEREAEQTTNKDVTRQAVEELETYRKLESELRARVSELEGRESDEQRRLRGELETRGREQEAEQCSYREAIKQHSVTICAMEERLNKVVRKNKDYQAELSQLKKVLQETKSRKPSPPPKPKVIIQKPTVDVAVMEQSLLHLQRENAGYMQQLKEQHDVILALRRDLAGAQARMSDMTGELSESQKESMERNNVTVRKQEAELVALRQQLAKLSEIVDKQANEITNLNSEINKERSAVSRFRCAADEKALCLREMEGRLETEKEEAKKSLRLLEEEGRITSELSALGAQCRGERHEQVMARQREALTELRARIKAMEASSPPLPTHDQALQQVVLLKKELAELRASQLESLPGVTAPGGPAGVGDALQAHINRARGIEPQGAAEAEHERTAHRETLESLELSEETYLCLLRSVASALELDEIQGLRSMAHIPRDERQRLARDRDTARELLLSRLSVLRERIARKDELLQGYEKDLAKLRQAEKLADVKQSQVESLSSDVRSRSEEAQYLRESLHRTKDRLEQEKRLNGAIKQKKALHMDGEMATRNGWSKHHCPPEDIMGKDDLGVREPMAPHRAAAKKKATTEKYKKKNYEIKTLKTELTTKERDLIDARRRLITMETNMGLDSQRDPLEPPTLHA